MVLGGAGTNAGRGCGAGWARNIGGDSWLDEKYLSKPKMNLICAFGYVDAIFLQIFGV